MDGAWNEIMSDMKLVGEKGQSVVGFSLWWPKCVLVFCARHRINEKFGKRRFVVCCVVGD